MLVLAVYGVMGFLGGKGTAIPAAL